MNEASPAQELAPPELAAMLGRIAAAVQSALGPESPLSARVRSLNRRFVSERLQIAVLGQFKRGKSTFLNALLGAPLLPTGVVPVTAVATFIAWRAEPLVIVRFAGGRPSQQFTSLTVDDIRRLLFGFVAEEANSKNELGIARVELYYPSAILADGIVIIDTPGVGSTLTHNSETALQVLPESDAAFFVLSADPPITEAELHYLQRVERKVPRIFFVLNKADYLDPQERRSVLDFLKKVLREHSLLQTEDEIVSISARDALDAKEKGAPEALESSGLAALEAGLVKMLAREKRHLLAIATRDKAAEILGAAAAEVELRRRTLTMPLAELGEKAKAFQAALRAIEQQRHVIRHLLEGDSRRLQLVLDARTGDLRRRIAATLAGIVDTSLANHMPAEWEEATRRALAAAVDNEFEAARDPLAAASAADVDAALTACRERVDTLVQEVRRTAAQLFDMPLARGTESEPFALAEDPYWLTEGASPSLIPDPSRLVDRLLPLRLRRARVRGRMIREMNEVVVRNCENLRWAIWRGLDETFRKATARFDARLDAAISITSGLLNAAVARRRDQSSTVEPEIMRLICAGELLARLEKELDESEDFSQRN